MSKHGLVAISALFMSFFTVSCGPQASFGSLPEINFKIVIEKEQMPILLADDPSVTIFAKGFKENGEGILILSCPCYVADSTYNNGGLVFKVANEELRIERLKGRTTRFQFTDMNVSAAK